MTQYRIRGGIIEVYAKEEGWVPSAWNSAPPSEAGRLALDNPTHPVLPFLRQKFQEAR